MSILLKDCSLSCIKCEQNINIHFNLPIAHCTESPKMFHELFGDNVSIKTNMSQYWTKATTVPWYGYHMIQQTTYTK